SGMPGDKGWYPKLEAVFAARDFAPFQNGEPTHATPGVAEPPPQVYDAWSRPIQELEAPPEVALPADPGALENGALVPVASEHGRHGMDAARAAVSRAAGATPTEPAVARVLKAAERVTADPAHGWLFDPARYDAAWNEARLSTAGGNYGV